MRCRDLPYVESIDIADRLHHLRGFAFLDSAGEDLERARYSYIGILPFGEFTIKADRAAWNGEWLDGPPLLQLRAYLDQYRIDRIEPAPALQSGCIGHISYDLRHQLETLDFAATLEPKTSDLRLSFYDVILAFDRLERRLRLFSSGLPEKTAEARAVRAERRMEDVLKLLQEEPVAAVPAVPIVDWRSNFTADSFCEAVKSVQAYILGGDIYQANLAQRFEAALPSVFDAWAFYRNLRRVNPAPFAAYLRDGDTVMASSSPERFMSLNDKRIEARPIKGTSRRAADADEDRRLGEALRASEKDRAENVMIVDLLRNDLSRICLAGTVEVPVLCGLESYAAVHHLTSVVRGVLRPGLGPVDVIEACFPGGSITGAPKIRAMDIITELERVARGVYCGSIGYIGFDGSLDLNIAIRTAVIGGGRAVFQAGGGITLLSDPASEYAETLTKADRLFTAFAAK